MKISTFICLLVMVCTLGGTAYAQDTTPPSEVDTLVVYPNGDGTTIGLDWTGYDESVDGDIQRYRIYQSLSNFSDAPDATLLGTIDAGNFSYAVQNLERDTTYWFAVVAVDELNNADDQVMAVSGTPIDKVAPQEATGLKAQSVDDTLTFSWNPSINSDDDLAGYRVYFEDDTQGDPVAPDQNSYSVSGLQPATGYQFRVTAVDLDSNESSGVSVTGITLLDNPAVTTISPRAGGVKLFWDAAEPSEYVKQYRLYMSESEFSSVEGMVPKVLTTSLSTAVSGLVSEVTYHFAVTVVNISDGEQKVVNIVSASPITGTNVSGEITNNTNWTLSGSPYVVTGDITIRNAGTSYNTSPVAATLSIEPGVQIRFEPGTGLYVGKAYSHSSYSYFGALAVQGTSELPVTFTSNKTSPVPGDWKGIYFRDETLNSGSVLEHSIIEYGGHTNNANLYFADSSPTVKNSTIRFSSSDGLSLNSASPTINSNSITDNSNHGISSDGSSLGWITDNNFAGNGQAPINIHPNGVKRVSGTNGTGNGQNYIRVYGGKITANATWVKQPLPYVIAGDITIRNAGTSYNTSPVAATLTIEPGVEIRFEPGTGLYVGESYYHSSYSYFGALAVQGTSELPVIFTSNKTSPVPGDWKGIYFRDETLDSKSVLEHGIVEYGGHTHSANLYFASSSPTITNNTVRYSSSNGVYVEDSAAPLISSNYFYGNSGPAINVSPNRVSRTSGNSDPDNEQSYIGVRGGDLTLNSAWVNQGLPYVIFGDVTIRNAGTSYNTSPVAATLTIEPGVEIRFEPGIGLYVGKAYYHSSYSYFGALSVQGTSELPVIFTSNQTSPIPGDWKGIYFRTETLDFKSLLEHCLVEYGGHTNNANIYLANAKPTIQYNTIRNSSHSGIYVNGTGANGTAIRCNNLKDNHYGIYIVNNAAPVISSNNFLHNKIYGINNTGSASVSATNNWWNDVNGPGYNGDDVSGNVNVDSWLLEESDCIASPPTNTAPFVPKNPVPASGAVRVPVIAEGQPIAVTLGWAGGDPNPWDAVVYDVYFGTAEDTLVKVAEGLDTTSFDKAGLEEGISYYWKIVARDDAGGQTAGPVWHFTTLGSPPDLVVSDLAWQPATDLQAGRTITFSATVENTGSGPVVDAFKVELYVDGSSIGSKTVNPVMAANTVLPLSFTWTAATGSHTIEARADSQNSVVELYEENNTRTVDLPHVKDPTPPDLVGTVPANGASLKALSAIQFTLNDQYGVVDDAAVIAGVIVLDGNSQPVAGTVTEASDHFTFTPSTVPLADDTYSVSLTARDLEGNTRDYNFSFTVDGQPPAEPTITGGAVLSGLIQLRPVVNKSKTATIILTGTREDNTAVYVNNQNKVAPGSGNWSISLNLAQGDNALEIYLQDGAGNHSPSVWVDIFVDSVAPAISGITPADNSFINAAPSAISVTFTEATSGLDLAESLLSVKDLNQQPVDGSWAPVESNQLVFTPTAGWADSNYTVNLQPADQLGNRGIAKTYHFTLDTAKPAVPVINPVSSPTHKPTQVVSGTKEADAALLLNGSQIVGHTAQTIWTYTASLTAGDNSLVFVARDRAGNQSDPVTVAIFFDDVPPPAVDTLKLTTAGDGRTIQLDWTGYNEAAHGDVAGYRIYRSTAAFTDVSAATLISTVNAGNFKYTATDLSRATPYWFAVVAVDAQGNARSEVSPLSGVAKDVVPPENVSNLIAQSFADRLVFTWSHSANSHGDLAGYRVVFEADGTNEIIAADRNSIEKTGLAPAGGYLFKVYAVDNDTNESSGLTVTGVTLLANPENLTAQVHSGYVDLSWSGVAPSQYVKHYAVYASESSFSSVAGMTPTLTSTNTSAKVAGLTDNVTYYFAVTTVNLSDGEHKDVAAISAKPEADSLGPEISSVKADGQPLAAGDTLTKPVTFSCEAQDPVGVSRVEFFIDGSLVRTDYNAAYTGFWNVVEAADGAHTLAIDAYDTLGNRASENFSLNVTLAIPDAPEITEPLNGTITNKTTVTVSGQAEKFTEVKLYNNGADTGVALAVDALGKFSTPLTLAEGANRLRAAAVNRAGEGPQSAEVLVTLDTTLPVSPSNLAAVARSAGAVRLTWKAPVAAEVAGYNLYRASSPFTSQQGAGRLNTDLIQAVSYDDLPPSDGTWYYRVSTVDAAGNESGLSAAAQVLADGTSPRAASIDYSPQGAFDAQTGTMAPGTVNVVLTVTEPLQSAPYLSIAPDGGIPIAVQLSKDTDTAYSGFFVIGDSTPSGTAYAIFSARDAVGNRGTQIDAGSAIQIDTDGPSVTRLVVSPPAPIENEEDSPVAVTVVFGLDEKIKSTEFPQLSYRLSGAQRQLTDIDTLTELAAQAGDVQTWQAQFELPADAGLTGAETFYFIFQGRDSLDNAGGRIQAQNIFQVYQGDLPPLAPPLEFKGQSLPGGKIRLTWLAVEEAVGYQLYRKAPGESELEAYARLDAVEVMEDAPAEDGLYTYAIASIRRENTREALSGLSGQVVVNSDAAAPGAPSNLTLELVANGIKVVWEPSPDTEEVTYSLYRSNQDITGIDGLTALATGIGQTLVVDPTPSLSDHWYAVTAVDGVGNQSAPSNAEYLNVQLLPVSGITVVQADNQSPAVTWTHPGGDIAGYDIYLGAGDAPVKLNTVLLTAKSYTDTGFSGDVRRYTIVTVDNSNVESLGRGITLPMLRAVLSDGSRIRRGIMNRLDYVVLNEGAGQVENIRLKVKVGSHDHVSEPFDLDPGTSRTIPVVVGGYDDLAEGIAALTTTIEVKPQTGETVQIIRGGQIQVADGTLGLQILNQEFTRAASGRVQFSIENTGDAEIEIVTAKNSGNSASDQIIFYLLDEDGNVLSTQAFKQATGSQLVTLSNKNTVARIGAGETFRSDLISMPVPANAPDNVIIRLAIAHVYYHQGQATQVVMDGVATTHAVTLADTAYYGELLDITPQNSTGDQDIVITGQAVERSTDEPMANVPLTMVITLNGFERSYDVYTGEDGTFTHSFQPLSGESGIYRVRAVHPDLTDKPVHGQFVINKVAVTPSTLNLNAPKNYTNTIQIRVQTGDGTTVDNLRLEYAAEDQPTGEKPAGVHLTPGQPVAQLGGKKTAYLPFTIWADNTAGATEKMILKVKAGTTDPQTWGTVTINARFSEAKPSLYFSPNHMETGVARDNTVSEIINLENKGLADLYDMQLSLLDAARNPAPSWIYLNSAVNPGNLAVGEAKAIGFAVSPTPAVAEGLYSFYLRVAAANHPTTDINLYVAVTQQGQGKAMFKVSDIYTDEVVQGLAGAKVKLQNEAVLTQEYLKITDSIGEAWFEDLPAGRYKCRITAANHQEYIGRVWIKPGVTTGEDIFLDYNLVTVEWSVTETTIQDKYDIVLTAVYETNVPAAVVVIEPASVTLPQMRAGDVFNGEFTLTNYGLIRADNLNFSLPADDRNFKYEMLGGLPDSLEAKQRITVAYRVTCLKSLDSDDDGAATGGGCYSYRKCAQATYQYDCANEVTANGSTTYCWTSSYGSCGGGAGPGTGGGGGTWSVGGGSTGGTVSKPAPQPKQIEGVKCFPEPPREEKFCLGCWVKDTFGNVFQDTFSSVNLVMREYYRDHVDLSVKAPGGTIEAKRWYYGSQWRWEHERNKLSFQSASIGGGIELIDKGGVKYERSSTDADIFIHDIFRIVKTETGYRWQDPKGGWIYYDASGNVTSHGSRSGVLAKLLYQDGKLSGVADRNDNQLLWYETDDDGLITAVRDSDNRRVEYSYTDGKLSKVKDVQGYETSFEYENQGRLEKIIEPAGRIITVSYDRYNGVASVVDSRGEGFFFDYDFNEATREQYARIETSAGKVKEVWYDRDFETRRVDINGRTVEKIAKDGRNLLVTDEQGNVTRKNYDEWDNLTQVIYPDGSSVSYAYEHKYNKRIEATDENGVVTRYGYDDSGNLVSKVEAAGTEYERITEYAYDDDGNLLTTRRLADANTAEALTQLSYDAQGNLTSITDPEAGITRFTSHDAMGNVLTKIDARGKQWDYEYDNAGQLKKIIDPLDNASELFYDEMGKKIKEVDANNNEKTFEYDARNNLIKVTDALGNITRFEYDADGKLLRQIDPEEKIISYEYDLDGRLLKTIDGNGNQIAMEYADAAGSDCSSCSGSGGASNQPSRIAYPTFAKEFVYDKRGRKAIEKDVLSATETYLTDFDYDPAGNLIDRTDKEDRNTGYAYDALNRLQTVTDPLNQNTEYFYDNRDNLTALTDAAGNTTWFEYDRNNRLVKEIRPEGQQTIYQYDQASNLTAKIDAKNQKTEYDYDDAGRLEQIHYFAATDHVNAAKSVTFSYDAAGNLSGYTDGITSAVYTYDDLYRKLSEKVNYGPFELANSYTYYRNGLKKTFSGPDGIVYEYTYDDNNQLTGVNIPGTGYITYSSYQWSRPTEVILPGGSKREYAYDPQMRVKSIGAKDPAQNYLMNYQYNYDKMDNIIDKATEHGQYDYDYDELYRLTGADNSVQNDEGFSYDAVGNRLTAAGVADNWSYNDNNELQGYAGITFEYDDSGNMTKKTDAGKVANYIYNVEDRLERVEDGSGSLISQYYYDPFGRRLWKEVGGVKTYFVYADEGLVAEVDAAGNVVKSYGYRPGSTWTTDPLFMKVGGQYYFYHNDHLGTPQKLTAVNGAVVWSAKYSSFGEAKVGPSSTIVNNLRFPGQYFDQETELNYNYFRFYDYVSSRYNRPDPAGIMRGTNHRYLYTKNNPLLFIDPLGLLCKKISSGSYTYVYSYEEIDRGNWIYEKYLQANIGCGCISYRDLRIDYITKFIDYEFDIYECTEMDECDNEVTFIRIGPGVKVSEDVFIESEYGGRERKIEFGTMEGTGGDIESGGGCNCSPNSIEPGWYQHNPVPQNRN